jgi:hypothetical protein
VEATHRDAPTGALIDEAVVVRASCGLVSNIPSTEIKNFSTQRRTECLSSSFGARVACGQISLTEAGIAAVGVQSHCRCSRQRWSRQGGLLAEDRTAFGRRPCPAEALSSRRTKTSSKKKKKATEKKTTTKRQNSARNERTSLRPPRIVISTQLRQSVRPAASVSVQSSARARAKSARSKRGAIFFHFIGGENTSGRSPEHAR